MTTPIELIAMLRGAYPGKEPVRASVLMNDAAAALEAALAVTEAPAKEAERWNDVPGIRTNDDFELWQDGNYECRISVGQLRAIRDWRAGIIGGEKP